MFFGLFLVNIGIIKDIYPHVVIPMLYFIWSNPNKIFTVVNAVAINVMVQCSETELGHYINANGINYRTLLNNGHLS